MNQLRISLLTIAFAAVLEAGPVPTPYGTIAGVAITGTGSGQFAQSSPQAGEIQFSFTLNNGEIISGEVCTFGAAGCVANGSGAIFNPAAPQLYASFSVGCGRANCAPISYSLSADYAFVGNVIGSDSVSGSFASNDIAGMNPSDSVSFHGAVGGSAIGSGLSVSPTGGVASYPFSGSDGPQTFINGGSSVTANLNGSITIAGPEDTLNYHGDVALTAAGTTVPEPAGLGLTILGVGAVIGFVRRRK